MDIDNSSAELDSLPDFKCGFKPACEIKYKTLNSQTTWSALDSALISSQRKLAAFSCKNMKNAIKNIRKNSLLCRNSGILSIEKIQKEI